jgi:hypothetical protein
MVDKIDGATIVIGGDSRPAEAAIERVAQAMDKLGPIAVAVGAAIGAAFSFDAILQYVGASQKALSALSKLSDETGATVLGLQAVEHAANLGGVAMDGFGETIKKVSEAIAELEKGKEGAAADAFEKLGIAAEDLQGLDIDKQFAVLAEAVKASKLSVNDMNGALKDLGITSAEVIALLHKGGQAFTDARNEVIGYGTAVSDIDAKQVQLASESWDHFKKAAGEALASTGNQIAIAFAPILDGLAKQFESLTTSSGGWSANWNVAIDGVISGFGLLMDAVALVAVVLQKLVDIGVSVGTSLSNTVDYTEKLFRGLLGLGDAAAEGQSAISKAFEDGIQKSVKDSTDIVKGLGDLLRSGLGGDLPSEKLDAWVQKSRAASQAAAQAAIDAATAQRVAAASATDAVVAEEDKKLMAQQKAADTHLQALLKHLLTAEDFEMQSYQRRFEQLIAFNDQGLLTQQQYDALVERNNQVHFEKMNQAQAAAFTQSQALYTGLANQVGSLLGNITTAIGSEGKKQFALSKAIALASAIVKGYESIVSAYAAGSRIGGPPTGAIFAGIAAAATAVQIAGLRSTTENSTGGGSSAPSSSSGAEAAGALSAQTLRVEGLDPNSLITGIAAEGLAKTLLQYQADGGKVVFGT